MHCFYWQNWQNDFSEPYQETWYDGILILDENGNPLSEQTYERYIPYREGVAAVQLQDKWGYTNTRECQTDKKHQFAKKVARHQTDSFFLSSIFMKAKSGQALRVPETAFPAFALRGTLPGLPQWNADAMRQIGWYV